MKKYFGIGGLLVFLFAACGSDKDRFVLDGKLSNVEATKKVLLYEGNDLVDSAFLNEKGEFRFRRNASQPKFYSLSAGNNEYYFVLQNGEQVDFKADLQADLATYDVQGSPISSEMKEYSSISAKFNKDAQALEREFKVRLAEHPDRENEIRNELMPTFRKNLEEYSIAIRHFADRNLNNLAGFYAASSLDPAEHEQYLMTYADKIKGKFSGNSAVQRFVTHMAELKPLSVGQVAPDFESLDEKGKTVKLSDFRGQYTLLDFWASWCTPCRMENPNIVKQYQLYKHKNFDILGVSLDNDQNAWKKAIKADGLSWTHVSDLNAWNSKAAELYKITGIPASFLLDPDGVIIAKNLRGEALAEFLKSRLH